ncbi:MAG: 2OG-Fe(II) Oxygenase, partial [Trebouxia sp. A1-2]
MIKDDCLAETVCEQLHAKAVQLHSAGNMEKATKVGLMPDMPLDKFTDVSARGDSITWLHEGSLSGPGGSAGLHAMQLLQEVQADLHSVMHLEKRSAEYQLAVYVGGGSQYVKHRDALPDDGADPNQRRVTAILYANPDWRPADGGHLRIWLPPGASSPSLSPLPGRTDEPQQSALDLPGGQHLSAATASGSPHTNGKVASQQHAPQCQEVQHSAHSNYSDAVPGHLLTEPCDRRSPSIHIQEVNGERVLDIAPVSGRLVVFLSGAIDHAVLPSHNPRVALTAWCQ